MRKQICTWILSIGMAVAFGQEQPKPKILTFEEAVKMALQNGLLLNQQKNNLQLAQVQQTQSVVAMGPSVTLNANAYQVNGNSFNQNTGTVINGIRDNVNGSINASINLFSGFNRINSIKQYSHLQDAQAYYVNRTQQDLINTVSTQYLQVLFDVELVKIAKENFEVLDKQLQQVKEQVSLGARSPVDEYNQSALTKGAELRFVQAEIALTNDKTLLTQSLLIDPFEEYAVEKPLWDINKISADEHVVADLADKAKQSRGDYLRAVKTENAYRFSTAAAKGNMMPNLFAFGTFGSAYNYQHGVPDSDPGAPRPFAEQFGTNNVYKQYGFQLQIPVFNGLQNRTAFAQQRALYENATLNRKNVELQIQNEVIRAVKIYEGAKKSYAVSTDQLTAAELALQYENERYSLGVTNFVDFANANRVFVQAQTDKAQAEYRLLFQKVLIDYAVGTLKPEDLE